jgi:type I restriction enzyme R subunit
MDRVGKPEIATQKRVIEFFQSELRYRYIGNLKDRENRNIDEGKLTAWLVERGHSEAVAVRAVEKLVKAASDLQDGLYAANREVYRLLKYGAKVKENADESETTVYFIDWETPGENLFDIAEEVTVVANNEKRPDLVIYLNGIAVAVIELKKSTVSVSNGIRQNLTNQREMFIEPFFTTIQFCMAGNDSEGLRYGVIKTPEKYYLEWKKDGFGEYPEERHEMDIRVEEICDTIPNKLDSALFAMYYKARFLNLIHNFMIFDKGQKKVCRYNQYYGIMRAQKRLTSGKGGIIWHTQGSGKSLTMIWLSKWLLSNIPTARVLIVTDRDELDEQIERNYKGVNETIVRTRSGADLLARLNSHEDRLLCSLIHKFGKRGGEATEKDYERYIEELKGSLPADFSVKDDIYVFVDECHRTQSGKLHLAMKTILPHAVFVGFTGTPLLKSNKATSIEVFGQYIHTYKFDEGVADGVVLDLCYEYRDIPQEIMSQAKIDAWFEAKTRGLMPRAKARLKQVWGNMQTVYSSRSRLEKIVCDIIFDFETKARLADGSGNAILVADDILTACKYYELFQQKNFRKCAVISSYEPSVGDLRTETVSDDEETDAYEKYRVYLKMIGVDPDTTVDKTSAAKRVEEFEKAAKKKFIDEPYNMKLLIVVDKLLTGFDAPPCTYMYIDKAMRDHGLFQAICRVNRLDGEDKDFGYIVDYKQLFGNLTDAMEKYTSGAFEGYAQEDVEGLLKDRRTEARKWFEKVLDELDELCEAVPHPREEIDYLHYFCGENGVDTDKDEAYARMRERMYRLVNALIRAYAEVKPVMTELGYSAAQQGRYDKTVNFYIALKATIGRSSGDFIDLKAYEPGMRYLIDNYIVAEDARVISDLDDFTLLDFISAQRDKMEGGARPEEQESAAEAIENNIRKKVVERIVLNPKYYEKMSAVLEQLIWERKQGVIAYSQLLEKYIELARNVIKPEENESYPPNVRHSAAMRALYDNTGLDAELAEALHAAVMRSKMDRFRNDPVKERRIKRELLKILRSKDEVERIFKIIAEQEEY